MLCVLICHDQSVAGGHTQDMLAPIVGLCVGLLVLGSNFRQIPPGCKNLLYAFLFTTCCMFFHVLFSSYFWVIIMFFFVFGDQICFKKKLAPHSHHLPPQKRTPGPPLPVAPAIRLQVPQFLEKICQKRQLNEDSTFTCGKRWCFYLFILYVSPCFCLFRFLVRQESRYFDMP